MISMSPKRVVFEESERDRSIIEFGAGERNVPVDPRRMQAP